MLLGLAIAIVAPVALWFVLMGLVNAIDTPPKVPSRYGKWTDPTHPHHHSNRTKP